jgi:hypothetical protein
MILNSGSKSQIRFLVSREHVSATDEQIKEMILKKVSPIQNDSDIMEQALSYAVQVHHSNQGLYNHIMHRYY